MSGPPTRLTVTLTKYVFNPQVNWYTIICYILGNNDEEMLLSESGDDTCAVWRGRNDAAWQSTKVYKRSGRVLYPSTATASLVYVVEWLPPAFIRTLPSTYTFTICSFFQTKSCARKVLFQSLSLRTQVPEDRSLPWQCCWGGVRNFINAQGVW